MATPAKSITVLYIDDEIFDDENDEFSANIEMLRTEQDICVEVALDGTEALHALREGRSQPDIIVLDIMMPPGDELATLTEVKNGYETGFVVLRKMREELGLTTPVIILTNYPVPLPQSEEERLGVVRYLEKPIAMTRLATIIRDCIKRGVDTDAQYDHAELESLSR